MENELFQGKLRMAPGQRGLLLDAAMGNPATLINLTERMKPEAFFMRKTDSTAAAV